MSNKFASLLKIKKQMAMMEIAESQAPLPLISKFFKSPKVCTYRCYDRDGYGGFDCWVRVLGDP